MTLSDATVHLAVSPKPVQYIPVFVCLLCLQFSRYLLLACSLHFSCSYMLPHARYDLELLFPTINLLSVALLMLLSSL